MGTLLNNSEMAINNHDNHNNQDLDLSVHLLMEQ